MNGIYEMGETIRLNKINALQRQTTVYQIKTMCIKIMINVSNDINSTAYTCNKLNPSEETLIIIYKPPPKNISISKRKF